MDLQAKKLHVIQEILSINNEGIIDKLEIFLKNEQEELNPLLKEKLSARALRAEEDIAQGRTMTRNQLEEQLNERLGL